MSHRVRITERRIYEIQNEKEPESVENQLNAVKSQLEKFQGVSSGDINRQIVDELFDKIMVEPSAASCATLTFHMRGGKLEKWGFPLRCSDYMVNTLHSEQHTTFSRKTCIKGQNVVFYKYKYLLAL